jgi:hypothetical protein
MSHQLISHNQDLRRLLNEGYEIEVRSNLLFVYSVPYVNSRREVALGALVSELTTVSPGVLGRPCTHQIHFIGEHPCKPDGSELVQIKHSSGRFPLPDLIEAHYFSNKPRTGFYADYYEKVTTYVRVISNQARAIDPKADARTFRAIEPLDEESVFLYEDTASSRAGIQNISALLKLQRIAIVGLGGTGAYVLDLVSKTHVQEIHLYDGDAFHPHNAFRSPGAASRTVLDRRLTKVAYFFEMYSGMRLGIVPHPCMVTEDNVAELATYDFIFVCVDKGSVRNLIVEALFDSTVKLIDVGMGVNLTDDCSHLWGTCRVTTSTPNSRAQAKTCIPKVDRNDEIYALNIQVADLNCMNAVMAVMKWKRLSGFYFDDRHEYNSTFNVGISQLTNEELTA